MEKGTNAHSTSSRIVDERCPPFLCEGRGLADIVVDLSGGEDGYMYCRMQKGTNAFNIEPHCGWAVHTADKRYMYYELLGITRGASAAAIKKGFRNDIMRAGFAVPPDKNHNVRGRHADNVQCTNVVHPFFRTRLQCHQALHVLNEMDNQSPDCNVIV